MAERQAGNPLSYLDEVRIRDGQVFMRDDRLGLSWAAPAAEISLRRDVAGVAGDISLAFAASGDPASLAVAFLSDKSAGVRALAARLYDTTLPTSCTDVPDLSPLRGAPPRIPGTQR